LTAQGNDGSGVERLAPRFSAARPPSSRQADFIDVAAGAWFIRRSVFRRLTQPVRDQIPVDPYGIRY